MRRARRSRAALVAVAFVSVAVIPIAVNLSPLASLPASWAWTLSATLVIILFGMTAVYYRQAERRADIDLNKVRSAASALITEVSVLEDRANNLLRRDLAVSGSLPTSLSQLRVHLVEQGIWADEDLVGLDTALRVRNAVAHGDIDEVDDAELVQALADVRRLDLKLLAWSSRANVPSDDRLWVLIGHTGAIRGLAVAPDGAWLASVSDDRTVRLWDASNGVLRLTLTGHTDWIRAVAIAPTGEWLASAGDDLVVRLWDARTGEPQAVLFGHTDRIQAIIVAPAGDWLASAGSDGTMRLWDVASGRQRRTLTHVGGVFGLAVASDGTWLASAGSDGTVRLWDVASGRQRHELTGHVGGVFGLAVASDGTWLASGGDDRTVRLWDPGSGRLRKTLIGHTDLVDAVAAAPNSEWLASGGYDATVRMWQVTSSTADATQAMPIRDMAALVDQLLQIPQLAEPQTISRIITLLPDAIRSVIPFTSNLRLQLVSMIRTCERFPHGQEALITALREGLGNSDDFTRSLPGIEHLLFSAH